MTALLGFVALGCSEEPPLPPDVVRPVKIFEVGHGRDGERLDFPGTIAAVRFAEIGFEVAGRITQLDVDEGQPVEEGDVLARLDPTEYRAALESARSRLAQAETELERAQYLFDQGVGPRVDVERRKRNADVLRSNVVEARKVFEDAVLRAPFDGEVARRMKENFQNVQAKEPVLIVQDLSELEIKVNVPERDLARGPREGDLEAVTRRVDPRVVVTSLPDRSFPARVTEFATTADPVTRTFEVTLRFAAPDDLNILPGMTAKVTIRRARVADEVLTIPAGAVVSDPAEAFVWVVDRETMQTSRRPVEIGPLQQNRVTIVSGLAPGDRVVVSGVHQLTDGMQVRELEP